MKVTNEFTNRYVGKSGIKVSNTNNFSILITNTYGLHIGLSMDEAKDLRDILKVIFKESNGRK